MTTFLTFAVQALNFNNFLPVQSTYIPLIIIYFICSILCTFFSFVWFISQNYLLGNGSMPKWLEKVALIAKNLLFFFYMKPKSKVIEPNKETAIKIKQGNQIDSVHIESVTSIMNDEENQNVPKPTNSNLNLPSSDKKEAVSCNKCEMCSKCKEDKEKENKKKDEKKKFEENISAINFLFLIITFIALLTLNLVVWSLNLSYQNTY